MKSRVMLMAAVAIVASPVLMGVGSCPVKDDCAKIRFAKELACSTDPRSAECLEATALEKQYCSPKQDPTTPPPADPCAGKVPICRAQDDADCWAVNVKGECAFFPKAKPEDPGTKPEDPKPATKYTGNYKVNSGTHGQGVDSTPTTIGDPEYCASVGYPTNPDGTPGRGGCPFYSESNMEERAKRELATLNGCPTWQWYTEKHGSATEPKECLRVDPYDEGGMSCDHFGNAVDRDDPITPAFEGQPQVCGAQRDAAGNPKAGFFTIAHGDGWVRACDPKGEHCGNWTRVIH